MSRLSLLEQKLDVIFVQRAPRISANGIQIIVRYVPYTTMAFGVLTLWNAYRQWQWVYPTNSTSYTEQTATNYYIFVWYNIISQAIGAILCILAFSGLRKHRKIGWNLLICAVLVDSAHSAIYMLLTKDGVGSIIFNLIWLMITAYVLFQIRRIYSTE